MRGFGPWSARPYRSQTLSMNMTPQLQALELDESECWSLLREAVVGRLAVVIDDAPDIFPVNHVVDHGAIVFRTAGGTKLDRASGHRVAFEVDGYDTSSGQAWSVVVKGTAHEIKQLHDVLDAFDLDLHPWHAKPGPAYVRIEPDHMSGRRFHARIDETTPLGDP